MESERASDDSHEVISRPRRGRSAGRVALLSILVVAAVLRVAGLTHAPPGLNQDEAANAWNAWCLLETGHDQHGVSWPVFYARALGENRSTLYMYVLLPFQLLGGLNVWTTRLPAALGGIVTVWLVYWLAARWFDRPTGLVAAGLLALNPWHIQLTRVGHEAALTPLLVCLALAAVIWAGFPVRDGRTQPAAWRALLAGLIAGGACYGYPAVRLFLPLALAAFVAVSGRAWWRLAAHPRERLALAALALGVGVTLGPLAYQHVAHPEQIARRSQYMRLWGPDDPLGARLGQVASRYAGHFGPDFLFITGDPEEIYSSLATGCYHWYILPAALTGLAVAIWRCRRSRAARLLLCWLVLYPAGDSLHGHMVARTTGDAAFTSLHSLRSSPGLPAPILLGALGIVSGLGWLWRHRQREAAGVVAAVLVLAAFVFNVRFLTYYFGPHTERLETYRGFHVDLLEACAWLRPRMDDADAVFITASGLNMPYVVTMVALEYDPRQWLRDEKVTFGVEEWEWDFYSRVGKFHFIHGDSASPALRELTSNDRLDRVIFLVRPGETTLTQPVHTITAPPGIPMLEIHDVQL